MQLHGNSRIFIAQDFADYVKAGIRAFGLGGSLYKPGMTAADITVRAKVTIEAYDRAVQDAH